MILRNDGLLAVGETLAQAFLQMYHLGRAREIRTGAQAGGAAVVTPPHQVCDTAARQLRARTTDRTYRATRNTT